ncbi:MarR family transcriptional regulator [Lentzea kentuckyensis]|uniref:MarR family transcriptional regulator n=1 Tax=Lentzea kentuckyensis TaxID=360086 RepID=UPI000A39F991|nr:MarR family transcriptional regulator [Lentzea kentuckyensis]
MGRFEWGPRAPGRGARPDRFRDGRRLNRLHSTTSGIVDRLQARGLVTWETDPQDRRYTRVQVTAPMQQYKQNLVEGP